MNKVLAVTFATLLSLDGALTYWAIQSGQFQEQNPLMAPHAGSPLFVLYKVATAVIAILIIGVLVHRFPRLRRLSDFGLGLFSLLYVAVLASNLWEVFTTL
jgi:hypothetical protein